MDFNPGDFINAHFSEKNFAIGNDIVFLPDFRNTWNELFRNKAYTAAEISYCELFDEPLLRYASTWAAKEAVYKAIKQFDPTALGFKGIEIVRKKPAGQPFVRIQKHENKFEISLSITHDGDYVWAIAVVKIKVESPN